MWVCKKACLKVQLQKLYLFLPAAQWLSFTLVWDWVDIVFHIFQCEIMVLRVALQIWHWPSNADCAVVTSVLPTGNTKRRQFMTATSAIFVGNNTNKQTKVANHIDYLVI